MDVFQHLVGQQRLQGSVADEVADDDVAETLALRFVNRETLVLKAEDVPHAPLAPRPNGQVLTEHRVAVDHLGKDAFEFIVGGEVRRSGGFLQKDFHEFSADVLLFFGELRLKANPKDLTGVVFVLRRLVDVDKNGFLGDVDEVEWTLLFGVTVQRTVVGGPRAVPRFEVAHPFRNVRMSRHDAGQIASGELQLFVGHREFLLSSPR